PEAGEQAGVDLENPNVIRAAMGSSFALPIGVGSASEVLAALRAANLRVVATTPDATTPHWQSDLRGGVALLLGREHEGLSPWWLAQADEPVGIPMRASAADSLNVSVAGAVLLYEALRQRTL
ncbi:MAG TPA: TrmH family RNA methyltransferase, partial [Trueperaceae bacterium]|nr:TrmH family RNA methyltransferase [Trueperaceae bacterium]